MWLVLPPLRHAPSATAPAAQMWQSGSAPRVASTSTMRSERPLLQQALAENRRLQAEVEEQRRQIRSMEERVRREDDAQAQLLQRYHEVQSTEYMLQAAVRTACQTRADVDVLRECTSAIVRAQDRAASGGRTEVEGLEAEIRLLKRTSQAKVQELDERRKRKRRFLPTGEAATQERASLSRELKDALAEVSRRKGTEAKAGLPAALSRFEPLAKDEAVKAAARELHTLELAVARDLASAAAIASLREQHARLAEVLRVKIAERTSKGTLAKLVPLCEAAITAGNRDFLLVYDGVFKVIQNGEAASVAAYGAAVAELRAKCQGEARQRREAADAAILFADAAAAKPFFDDVVAAVGELCGATLELSMLGDVNPKDGAEGTGLKKSYRCIEKAELRPGEERGRTDRVCDVVRAMLIANDMATVALVADTFAKLSDAGVVTVVRIKDRFTTASAGGWRDLMINFVVERSDRTQHICELQVVHQMMLTARKGLPGHEIYAVVRIALELVESCGQEHALRLQAVRSMRAANATAAEILATGEDAWVLEDGAWAGASKEEVLKAVTAADLDDEGRITVVRFAGNRRLTALPSLHKLQAVREVTFNGCTFLTAVELPAGLTSLGEGAFHGCTS